MFGFHSIPHGLRFFSPTVLLASFGGAGLLRPASGTWGSLAALPLGVFLLSYYNSLTLVILSITLCFIGVLATHSWLAHSLKNGTDGDPSAVVIDEAAGQWLTLAFIAPENISPLTIFAGFVLFRLFDILKPFPINLVEKKITGAWGVMLDDMVAGVMAGLVLYYGGSLFYV